MTLTPKLKRTLIVTLQIAVSILLLYLLFRNVDLAQAQQILSATNLPLLGVSTVFFVLSSFAIGFALHSALKAAGAAPPFGTTMLANLRATPKRRHPRKVRLLRNPVLLNQLKAVPIEKGLMSVMAVGAGNFFVKAIISTTALVYFIYRIPSDIMSPAVTNALIGGILILVVCGVGLAVLVWTNCFSGLLQKLQATHRRPRD